MMTDPIADMLARVRNAAMAQHAITRMPASKVKHNIAKILKDAGYIADVRLDESPITKRPEIVLALKYDRDSMEAPKCVAKGMDLVAQKIKEIAAEADVPMIENVPLARALYKQVEIDETIPEDMFAAVAEILVTIDRLNKKKKPKPLRAV